MKSHNISALLKLVMILTIFAQVTVYFLLGPQHQELYKRCKLAVESPLPTEEEYAQGYATPLLPPPVIEDNHETTTP